MVVRLAIAPWAVRIVNVLLPRVQMCPLVLCRVLKDLRWTASQDVSSAHVVSLQYVPPSAVLVPYSVRMVWKRILEVVPFVLARGVLHWPRVISCALTVSKRTGIIAISVNVGMFQASAPTLNCPLVCPSGYRKDGRGCDVCACADTPQCPVFTCPLTCSRGFVTDLNGCPRCHCSSTGPVIA